MEIEMLEKRVIPIQSQRYKMLNDFIQSKKKTMIVKCDDLRETNSYYNNFKRLIKKHNLGIDAHLNGKDIYVVKH